MHCKSSDESPDSLTLEIWCVMKPKAGKHAQLECKRPVVKFIWALEVQSSMSGLERTWKTVFSNYLFTITLLYAQMVTFQ